MSSMATGIPIGLAIGIAAGMASGRQQAQKDLAAYIKDQRLVILADDGSHLDIDTTIEQALKQKVQINGKYLLWVGIGVFTLALVAGAYFYFST
jgi:hypothetical protein